MKREELARILDHSVLKPEATDFDVRAGAELVKRWRIGYYCVQACWVAASAAALRASEASVVAVIAFPHGAERTATKVAAARLAVGDGAAELDMVMNVGALKSGARDAVADDIATVVQAVPGVPVKVILETGVLTDDEKRIACRLAREAGAAFVKTSTGYHASGGATVADVAVMRAAVGAALGVKASGGIRTLAQASAMLDAGATRIGTSASDMILAELDP